MSTKRTLILALLLFLAAPWAPAQAGVRVGVGIGIGVPYYPYYPYYYRPYYPYPVVVAPGPVYVAPQPVYAAPQPQPVYIQTSPGVFQQVSPQGAPLVQAVPQSSAYYQNAAPVNGMVVPPPRPIPVTTTGN